MSKGLSLPEFSRFMDALVYCTRVLDFTQFYSADFNDMMFLWDLSDKVGKKEFMLSELTADYIARTPTMTDADKALLMQLSSAYGSAQIKVASQFSGGPELPILPRVEVKGNVAYCREMGIVSDLTLALPLGLDTFASVAAVIVSEHYAEPFIKRNSAGIMSIRPAVFKDGDEPMALLAWVNNEESIIGRALRTIKGLRYSLVGEDNPTAPALGKAPEVVFSLEKLGAMVKYVSWFGDKTVVITILRLTAWALFFSLLARLFEGWTIGTQIAVAIFVVAVEVVLAPAVGVSDVSLRRVVLFAMLVLLAYSVLVASVRERLQLLILACCVTLPSWFKDVLSRDDVCWLIGANCMRSEDIRVFYEAISLTFLVLTMEGVLRVAKKTVAKPVS
jgi:hypothetical protein